ncbi:MAG: hypothetical protein KAH93_02925 [Candidatus Aenigmarchaeota archaeon]|nr:hypothetical protein [Candidatus Aenigmarchaeota archaeon]
MQIHKIRKSQVLSPDFTMSLVIFTAILFLSYTVWNTSQEKSMRFYDTEQMQKKALYVSDMLLNTPGIPPDWNMSNVKMAGFRDVDSSTLDVDKLINFRMLEYNHSKEVLGLGSYDYCINITDPDGMSLKADGVVTGFAAVFARDSNDDVIKSFMENYQYEWDYYWGGPVAPPNNATTVYDTSDVLPSTEHNLFKLMMANMSSYDTIIIEAENTFNPDAADELALKDFVSGGGTLIDLKDKGVGGVVDTIGHFPNVPLATNADASDRIGTMIERDILMPGVEVGETITFEAQSFRFNISEVDKAIVESDGHPGYCTVCLWYYGSGKIYFLPDGSDNTGTPIEGLDLDGIELIFGYNGTFQADDVVPIRRLITVTGGQDPKIGLMNLYIYK